MTVKSLETPVDIEVLPQEEKEADELTQASENAGKCDTCGNHYDKLFVVRLADGQKGRFDSFECAIQKFAPVCVHCGCRILGHGHESDGAIFCCAHCASHMGHKEMRDRS